MTIESGDVEAGLKAAAAIGDDRIQRMQTGRVAPDSFTHGSSEQRVTSFRRGLETGDPNACNTFKIGLVQLPASRSPLSGSLPDQPDRKAVSRIRSERVDAVDARFAAGSGSRKLEAATIRLAWQPPLIGRSIPRREGRAKVTGQARYVDDFALPGMLFGATVRSDVARGRILGIDFDPAIPWDEFTIVTAADIPGHNRVALILDDQPYLAADVINHPEEADRPARPSAIA